ERRRRIVVDEQVDLLLLQGCDGTRSAADADQRNGVLRDAMASEVVPNEEIRRGSRSGNADLQTANGFGTTRIERCTGYARQHETRVARQGHERRHVLVLALHLNRMIVEPHGNVAAAGDECLQDLRSALREVLGANVQSFL